VLGVRIQFPVSEGERKKTSEKKEKSQGGPEKRPARWQKKETALSTPLGKRNAARPLRKMYLMLKKKNKKIENT